MGFKSYVALYYVHCALGKMGKENQNCLAQLQSILEESRAMINM